MKRILPLFVIFVFLISSCAKKTDRVEFMNSQELFSELKFNIYAPYQREYLMELGKAKELYGSPTDFGEEQDGVFFDEYKGKYGRIRIYEEIIPHGADQGVNVFLRFFPSTIYLSDLIELESAVDLDAIEKIYLTTKDRSAWFTIMLEGKVVAETAEGKH